MVSCFSPGSLARTLDAPATPVIAGIARFAARANTEVNKLFQAEPQKDFDLFPELSSVKLLFALSGRNLNLDGDTFSVRNGEGNASLLTPFVNSGRPAALAIASSIVTTNLPDPASLSSIPSP